MLGENVNKTVFVVWAGAIVSGLFGVSMVLFPGAMAKVGDTIKHTTTNFMSPKADEVSLSVNIPDQKADIYYNWYQTKHFGESDTRTPLFEPNTTGWGEDYERNNDTWHRLFNYSDGVDGWKKSITNSDYVKKNFDSVPSEALVSPFEAKDSKGNDITKNIKFKSVKVTKLENYKGEAISTDTDDVDKPWLETNSHIPGIKFNHEYSDYKDMLYSIYGYSGTRGLIGTDKPDWYRVYIPKAYITATYSVSDDSGNSATKSSSFVVSIDPVYNPFSGYLTAQ